ncbi:hypothetical protein [Pontivivens insulae]|uniref:hypothetical protein n=1 Tax=Pontivivens insulae TaxID=1639689 RepID=UPI000D56299B|nr:hypothetical protein [Pontivivens insulae]
MIPLNSELQARAFVDQHLPQKDALATLATIVDIAMVRLRKPNIKRDDVIEDELMLCFNILVEMNKRCDLIDKTDTP